MVRFAVFGNRDGLRECHAAAQYDSDEWFHEENPVFCLELCCDFIKIINQ